VEIHELWHADLPLLASRTVASLGPPESADHDESRKLPTQDPRKVRSSSNSSAIFRCISGGVEVDVDANGSVVSVALALPGESVDDPGSATMVVMMTLRALCAERNAAINGHKDGVGSLLAAIDGNYS